MFSFSFFKNMGRKEIASGLQANESYECVAPDSPIKFTQWLRHEIWVERQVIVTPKLVKIRYCIILCGNGTLFQRNFLWL